MEETIVEVPLRAAPNGRQMIVKPYPKDNEPRTMGLSPELLTQLRDRIRARGLGPGDLLFATCEGTPISRNAFRTRVWVPAVKAIGVDLNVRIDDLRHAHASGLLAGGSDLRSVMDRMGHSLTTQNTSIPSPTPTNATSTRSDASPSRSTPNDGVGNEPDSTPRWVMDEVPRL